MSAAQVLFVARDGRVCAGVPSASGRQRVVSWLVPGGARGHRDGQRAGLAGPWHFQGGAGRASLSAGRADGEGQEQRHDLCGGQAGGRSGRAGSTVHNARVHTLLQAAATLRCHTGACHILGRRHTHGDGASTTQTGRCGACGGH